jgi:nicotinate-nucleotide--dimethylbenzimidazole phosphoribosyltransferase
LAATAINANAKDYMIFCHQSQEKGHQKMLEHLGVNALMDIGLRLGEGTGAALAMPLVNTALAIYNDMADLAPVAE